MLRGAIDVDYRAKVQKFVFDYFTQCTGLEVGEAHLDEVIENFGLTSIQGVLLLGEIEEEFNLDIPNELLLVGGSTLRSCINEVCKLIASK